MKPKRISISSFVVVALLLESFAVFATEEVGQNCANVVADALTLERSYFDLQQTTLRVPAEEVCVQISQTQSLVTFGEAIHLAVFGLKRDRSDAESPFTLAIGLALDDLPGTRQIDELVLDRADAILREHMNKAESVIELMPLGESPERGENVTDNWIFKLKMPTFSDHTFWIIIDRSGHLAPYTYGFN